MAAKPALDRVIFVVQPHDNGGWAVLSEGVVSEPKATKDEAKAVAHKLARACLDGGRPCQVTIRGEHGFFAQ